MTTHAAVIQELLAQAATHLTQPDVPVTQRLRQLAAERPNDVGLVWVDDRGTEVSHLTYGDLWLRAGVVATHLLSPTVGLRPGDAAVIVFPFGPEFMPALVGCMRAGITAVSVYPPNPAKLSVDLPRLQRFAEDARSRVALTTRAFIRFMSASKVAGHAWPAALDTWVATDDLAGVRPLSQPAVPTTEFTSWTPAMSPQPPRRRLVTPHAANEPPPVLTVAADQAPDPDRTAFVQYTSGSTGQPRGVVVTHRAIAFNVAFMAHIMRVDAPSSAGFIWLPQYHDMGLIGGFFVGLVSGVPLYAMSPITFIKNPALWIELMPKLHITHAAAPNFGWALAAKRVAAKGGCQPLLQMTEAAIGAEPIARTTLHDMRTVLGIPASSIDCQFGCAEMVLSICGRGFGYAEEQDHGPDPASEPVAACGSVSYASACGSNVVIVDPVTLEELPEGKEGLIWCQSPSMAAGYYGREEETIARFHCVVRSAGRPGFWYDSRDMGYVKNDQLYVLGRVADLIIVNGRNVYPSDIETAVNDALGEVVRPGSTVAFQVSPTEIAVVTEAKPQPNGVNVADTLTAQQLHDVVAARVANEHNVTVQQVLVCKKGMLPKTTSGKIRRKETRNMLLAGELTALAEYVSDVSTTPGDVELTVHSDGAIDADSWHKYLLSHGIVDPTVSLAMNGMDSLRLAAFIDQTRILHGINILPELADSMPAGQLFEASQFCGAALPSPPPSRDPRSHMPPPHAQVCPPGWHRAIRQTLAFLGLLALVTASAIPAGYVYQLIHGLEVGVQELSLFSGRNLAMPLMMLVPMTWMATFTVVLLATKWLLIGKYSDAQFLPMWSGPFMRWWLVDRVTEVWCAYVGLYLLDTPYLNVLYRTMGSRVPIMACRIKSFLREPDLVVAGPRTTISGMLNTRCVESDGVWFGRLAVHANHRVPSRAVAYPTEDLHAAGLEEPHEFEQLWVQRTIAPAVLVMVMAVGICISSWIIEQAGVTWVEWQLALVLPGSAVFALGCSVLLARLSRLEFLTNYIASCADGLLSPWIHYSPIMTWLYRLYGADLGPGVVMNALSLVAPAEAHAVAVGAGTAVSRAFLTPGAGPRGKIRIGSHVSVGYMSTLEAGATLHNGAVTFPRSLVPAGCVAQSDQVFIGDGRQQRTSGTGVRRAPSKSTAPNWWMLAALEPIGVMLKAITMWLPLGLSFQVVVEASRWLGPALAGWPVWAAAWFGTLYVAVVSAIMLCVLLVLAQWLYAPRLPASKTSISCPLYSLQAACFANVLCMDRVYASRLQPFIGGTWLCSFVCAVTGGTVASWTNLHVYEAAMHDGRRLAVGDGVVVDRGAVLGAHKMLAGQLVFARTTVGDRVSIHPGAYVRAGEQLVAGTTLCAASSFYGPQSSHGHKTHIFRGSPARACAFMG